MDDNPIDAEEQNPMEACMDTMHILPLNIIPLQTPSLRRARLIKNVQLESVVELFHNSGSGSGQIETSKLADMFGWPKSGEHPDERVCGYR